MLTVPIWALICHFIGDFVLQTDEMALKKSKDNYALLGHVVVYTLVMTGGYVAFLPLLGSWPYSLDIPTFALTTFVTHFATDYITSRETSKLWFFQPTGCMYNQGGIRSEMWIPRGGNYRHNFFVLIGGDQLIHYTSIAMTLWLLR